MSTTSTRGITYYQMGFLVRRRRSRPLYGYEADDGVNAVPDLAESDPEISEDGKTVTVKLKTGIKFSPPVDREVTSKDVKYAIERGFFNTVNNGYAGAYFGDLEGAKVGAKPGAKIAGIETPDDQTIVFNLTKGDRRHRWPARLRCRCRPLCRRSTRRSSTRRTPPRTARTRSRPART